MAARDWNLSESGPLGRWTPERSEKKKILPKQAEWILEHCNIHNRPIVNSSVATVENALNNGTWKCTGQPIIFAYYPAEQQAVLLDGQNRLWGCINSGKPMLTWVHFGVEDKDAFMAIDRGKNRNNADDLGILKEKNPKALAAALCILNAYDKGMRGITLVGSPKTSTTELLSCLSRHPQVRDSVNWAEGHCRRAMAPRRIISVVHYLAGSSENARVIAKRDEFFDRFLDGANLSEESPILALRSRFYAMANLADARVKRGMGNIASHVYLWCMARAWNAFLMGHELSKLQMPFKDKDRNNPADIPEIRSWFRRPSEKIEAEDIVDVLTVS